VSSKTENLNVVALVFDSLAFMRDHAKVFRRYMFLPMAFSIASLFLIQVPYIGLAASTVLNSLALALVGVSATRYYIFGTTNAVAEGANRAFARFFFLAFVVTLLTHMNEVFRLLPIEMQGIIIIWMIITFWINLRFCLAFPALAMEHPGSVWTVVRCSYHWTQGKLFKIIGAFMMCYSPMIFFAMLMMKVSGMKLLAEDAGFWTSLGPLVFSNILIIFGMMWSSIVLAKLYKGIVMDRNPSC
jgi:hypothetical protein